MAAVTVTIHFAGLMALLRLLRGKGRYFHAQDSLAGQAALIVSVVAWS